VCKTKVIEPGLMPIFLAGLGASPGSRIQNPAALLGLLFPDGRQGNLWRGRFLGFHWMSQVLYSHRERLRVQNKGNPTAAYADLSSRAWR
jgi:hypothetical protein